MREREVRRESSALLFGLVPQGDRGVRGVRGGGGGGSGSGRGDGRGGGEGGWLGESGGSPQKGGGRSEKVRLGEGEGEEEPRFGFDFFLGLNGNSDTQDALQGTPDFGLMGGGLDADVDAEQTFGALNLFPLLETDGHIDLANYF